MWNYGLEDLYIHMPAIGETGGQILIKLTVSMELMQPPPILLLHLETL